MEEASVFFSHIIFFLFSLPFSSSLQLQTLTLTPLRAPHTSSLSIWDPPHPDPDPDPKTLTFPLHHIDSTLNLTFRLHRDSIRVDALTNAAAAMSPNGTHFPSDDFSSSVVSGISSGSGEYFTRIGVGTPPRYVYMVIDTGSDVSWLQCKPCKKCYHQSDPVFDPARSRSFSPVSCRSPVCLRLDPPGCSSEGEGGDRCVYEVVYGDGSSTFGEFATETLTFSGTRVPRVALGCGHDNEGLFVGAAGLLGLGRGKLSFVSQIGRRFGKRFSYCLADRTGSGKPSWVIFGESAVSKKARFTPMLRNRKQETFYYVGLAGISVGGSRVSGITRELFEIDSRSGNGGVILDSGTSVTRLAQPGYNLLRDAFRAGTAGLNRSEGFSLFDTCYDLAGKTEVEVPTVVLHFDGADVELPASNYMIPVDTSGRFCFTFAGSMGGLSIIGNIQQQGFRVVFDLARRRIGFAPEACV